MLCKNCKKELPEESQFCPYCMTKFSEEKEVEPVELGLKKSAKRIIVTVVIITVAVAVAVFFAAERFAKPEPESEAAQGTQSEQRTFEQTSSQEENAFRDSALGFAAGKGDVQSPALKLLSSSFADISYNELVANEKLLCGAKMQFECVVLKVEGNTVFAEYGASKGFDGIYHSTGDYAALVFSQPIKDIVYGDSLVCFGSFTGVDGYNIGGESYDIPTIEIQSCTDFVYSSVLSPVYTLDEITAAAQKMFGKNIVVRDSVKDDFADSSIAEIIMDGGLFYTVEAGEKNFCFYAGEDSFIYDCASTFPNERYILPMANSERKLAYTFNKNSREFTVECLNADLSVLWQRSFADSYNAVMDYTSDYIYLVANANLYVIDIKTGKDAVKPRYVGNKCDVIKLEDSLLMVSPSRNEAVMITDLEGNVLRTTDLAYDMPNTDSDAPPCVQTVDSGYLISYDAQENGYTLGTYTAIVSRDGNLEFECKDF